MKIGDKVKITRGFCRSLQGRVTEIYTWEKEIQIMLEDGITTVTIDCDYVEVV